MFIISCSYYHTTFNLPFLYLLVRKNEILKRLIPIKTINMVSYTNSAAILLSLSSLTTAGAASGRKLSWSSGDSHDDNTTSDSPTYYPTTWSGYSHDDNDNGWKSSSSSSSKDAWGPSFKCIPKTNPVRDSCPYHTLCLSFAYLHF